MRLTRRVTSTLAAAAIVVAAASASVQRPTPSVALLEARGHPNGTATFRVHAPEAKDVRVMLETMAAADAVPLTKDDEGIWAGTIGPVAPDLYAAAFITDGVFRAAGHVHVTGATPEAWDPRPVPHGTVHHHWYDSKAVGALRQVLVYTPPGYERSEDSYPVLYLLHGSGGTEESWAATGLANVILDNQIADGHAVPMVVVMPFGHTEPSPRAGLPPAYTGRDIDAFTTELIDQVIPMVETTYRIDRRAASRAIAGFSMGGNQARLIGLGRLDLFGSVATMSGTIAGRGGSVTIESLEQTYAGLLANPDSTNARLKLLWVGAGSDETRLIGQHRLLREVFDQHGIRYTYSVIPGGHTWYVWRRNLRDIVALLFR